MGYVLCGAYSPGYLCVVMHDLQMAQAGQLQSMYMPLVQLALDAMQASSASVSHVHHKQFLA